MMNWLKRLRPNNYIDEKDAGNIINAVLSIVESAKDLMIQNQQLQTENEQLLHAAEHGLSLMIGRNDEETEYHLYHPCEGCENALKILQQHGIYSDVKIPKETKSAN